MNATSLSVRTPAEAPTVREQIERRERVAARRELPRAQPTSPGRYLAVETDEREILVPLHHDVTHVGRGVSADVRLDDIRVSRRHAIVVLRSTGHRIIDDRSANGLFVNGRQVMQAELRDDDIVVLGDTVLRYVDAR